MKILKNNFKYLLISIVWAGMLNIVFWIKKPTEPSVNFAESTANDGKDASEKTRGLTVCGINFDSDRPIDLYYTECV